MGGSSGSTDDLSPCSSRQSRLRLRGVLPDVSRDSAPPRPQRGRTSPAARGRRPSSSRSRSSTPRRSRSAASCGSSARQTSPIYSRSGARPRPQRQHRRHRGRRRTRPELPLPGARLPRRDERPGRAKRGRRGRYGGGRRRGAAPHRGDRSRLALELPPRCSFLTLVKVGVRVNNVTFEPAAEGFGGRHQPVEGPLSGSLERIPRVEAESALLTSVFRQSVVDLAALRVTGDLLGEDYVLRSRAPVVHDALRPGHVDHVPADALGRPSACTRRLHLLGALQATRVDDFRDEEPGRILHEVRSGELTQLGEKPHSPYYGTADATPLWLILLSEYWRFTGQDAFVLGRWDKVAAALAWIDRYGDGDDDDYVEYQTRSREGLGNQCWKDSWDGSSSPTEQSRTYRSRPPRSRPTSTTRSCASPARPAPPRRCPARRAARARGRGAVRALQQRLLVRGPRRLLRRRPRRRQAPDRLHDLEHGAPVVVGIVPEERAGLVAEQLMSRRCLGLGVRTLSTDDRGYNPIGYHIGTIWPHDNAIIALGLARPGFETRRIGSPWPTGGGRIHRLPTSGGVRRLRALGRPVSRSVSHRCIPQAWATGAPFVFVQAMLGLEARDGVLWSTRACPRRWRISVRGLHAFGAEWDVEAVGVKPNSAAPTASPPSRPPRAIPAMVSLGLLGEFGRRGGRAG